MKKMFICHTPYHILISIIKQLTNPEEAVLVLPRPSNIGQEIINQLNESGLFNRVIADKIIELPQVSFAKLLFINKEKRFDMLNDAFGFSAKDYQDYSFYIFNDKEEFGYWLIINKLNYHLIEDGLNCFQYKSFATYHKSRTLKQRIISLANHDKLRWGLSNYAIDIEVNKIEGVQLHCPKEKLKEVPRSQLFAGLSKEQKKQIIDVFCPDSIKKDLLNINSEEATLLITQPLSEDNYMDEENKIKVYRELAKQARGKLIVKPHPREKTDYSVIFPDAIVLNCNKVPLEVFSFFDNIHFAKAITSFSTCIDAIDFADEKISWGVEKTLAFAKDN